MSRVPLILKIILHVLNKSVDFSLIKQLSVVRMNINISTNVR